MLNQPKTNKGKKLKSGTFNFGAVVSETFWYFDGISVKKHLQFSFYNKRNKKKMPAGTILIKKYIYFRNIFKIGKVRAEKISYRLFYNVPCTIHCKYKQIENFDRNVKDILITKILRKN